jgi:ADP-heptose:LPS heptosyltransferase
MNTTLQRRRVADHGLRQLPGHEALDAADAPLPQKGILRILICRTSHSLGNTLLITPLLQEIEATWPGAEVDIVTRNGVAGDIFANFVSVREVYCLPKRALQRPLLWLRHVRSLRRNRYDLVIDTDQRSRTGRALLSLSRSRYKLGFDGKRRSRALTHAVDAAHAPEHAGLAPVYLLRSAMQRTHPDYPGLAVRLSDDEREQGRGILNRLAQSEDQVERQSRPVIGVFANATGHKLLDRVWWRAFLPLVEAAYPGFTFVEIAPASGSSMLDSRYPVYYSSSVRKLSKVLSGLSMLITLDCGVMHLARASGTRTAAVFTVTDPAQWGPYGPGAHVVRAGGESAEEAARRLVAEVPVELLQAKS